MLLKKTERNKKRRLQAIKRREKHKVQCIYSEETHCIDEVMLEFVILG